MPAAPAAPVSRGRLGKQRAPRLALGELHTLRDELNATKQYLQDVIEEHEAANEELRPANEEVQSSNEELQSTNEELETTKEEIQSTNEEEQITLNLLSNALKFTPSGGSVVLAGDADGPAEGQASVWRSAVTSHARWVATCT